MLDQNTDRMWYVIGAVIVGAALIFIMNSMMPNLFASVAETFEEKTEETTQVTDGIMPNTGAVVTDLNNADVRVSDYPVLATFVDYDVDTSMWTLSVAPDTIGWSGGLSIRQGAVEIPYGAKMTFSYDVWSPVDTHAGNDVNNVPVEGETWSPLVPNDNDAEPLREGISRQNPKPENLIPANEWTSISFTYYNTDPRNVNKVALYDYSTFGAHNPLDENMEIKIRNVQTSVTMVK